jgi:hypothetical protein
MPARVVLLPATLTLMGTSAASAGASCHESAVQPAIIAGSTAAIIMWLKYMAFLCLTLK